MIRISVVLFFLVLRTFIFSQDKNNNYLAIPSAIGIIYNFATEDNFLFNDKDYQYQTHVLKFQGIYQLRKWNNTEVELLVQPQIHLIQHQLLNEQFVLPSESNYLEKRNEFTRLRSISLYGLEFGLSLKHRLLKRIYGVVSAGVGIAYIDRRSERLAQGFTFLENLSFGFQYQILRETRIHSAMQFGHVSNFNFQRPNSGYNSFGIEIGLQTEIF